MAFFPLYVAVGRHLYALPRLVWILLISLKRVEGHCENRANRHHCFSVTLAMLVFLHLSSHLVVI